MTNERLYKLNELNRAILDLERVLSSMEENKWIAIDAPGVHVTLPGHLYEEFKAWVQQRLDEAKKQFEEA